MQEVYSRRGASLHQINVLAEWVRQNVANVAAGNLDVIRFVEIDLPRFFPGLYVSIEPDASMGKTKACISDDPFGLLVAENIYERASNGCIEAAETILHEVGHLFLHDEYKSLGLNDAYGGYRERIRDTNAANSAEWQAKSFATCMLYPYEYSKKYSKNVELQVYLNLNNQQSREALNHWSTLKLRESQRSRHSEARWLASVLKPVLARADADQPPPSAGQLDFFHRVPSSELAPAGHESRTPA